MTEKFQFQIDGRGMGSPMRDDWREAAQDAVNAGYAKWAADGESVHLDSGQGAAVALVEPGESRQDVKPRLMFDEVYLDLRIRIADLKIGLRFSYFLHGLMIVAFSLYVWGKM